MKNRRSQLQEHFREYFQFTRWQRRSLLVMVVLITIFALLPAIWPYFFPPRPVTVESIALQEVKELVARRDAQDSSYRQQWADERKWREPKGYAKTNSSYAEPIYFAFDPNTATEADFIKLGLRPKTAATIINYRSKGGRFRKPEDLLKIYSISPEQGSALLPHVRIAEMPDIARPAWDSSRRSEAFAYRPSRPAPASIDINNADTSAWIALPGIGSKLAGRIVGFRQKLGGFISITQVGETYGVPDSTFQKLKSRLMMDEGFEPLKININTATAEQLKAHPYFRWNLANAVVNYRLQHGPYKTVDDLSKIVLVEAEWLQKVRPYLAAE